MRRRRLISAVFLALLILCSGCAQSEKRAGDLLPILSAGISRSKDGSLTLTAEAVRQDSLEGNATPVYLTASGPDPDALFRSAAQLLAGDLYLSHARTVVVDAAVAQDGIPPLVQTLLTRDDVRLTMRIAIARNASADKIVRAQAVAQDIPGEALAALLQGNATRGKLPDLPLCRIADQLLTGADFSLPALTLTTDGRVIPAGQANFRLGRLVGFSGGEEDA